MIKNYVINASKYQLRPFVKKVAKHILKVYKGTTN